MASAPDSSMSDTLECPVCLLTFNLTDRCPKALVCHHTICGQCLETLKKPTRVMCPTCREDGDVSKVAVNFAVTDVLRALCEECTGEKHSGTCDHCKKQLCQSCTEAHAENVHGELLKTLDRVDQELADAMMLYRDDTLVSEQHQKESEAIIEIKDEMQRRRKAIDNLEAKLIGSVRATKEKNIDNWSQGNKLLGAEITKVNDFKNKTKGKISLKYSGNVAMSEMLTLKVKGDEALVAIIQRKGQTPAMEDFTYNKEDFTLLSLDATTMTEAGPTTQQRTVSTMTASPSNKPASTMTEAGSLPSQTTAFTMKEAKPTGARGKESVTRAGKNENRTKPAVKAGDENICAICMSTITHHKVLNCKHAFCTDCIDECFKCTGPKCPTCGEIHVQVKGTQPWGGWMSVNQESYRYFAGSRVITIRYSIPDGTQGPEHPNPGKPYRGVSHEAYLPDTKEGNKILELLRRAFDARLIFTVGRCPTTGQGDQVIWNGISHITSKLSMKIGYPNPTYLSRVRDELAAKGIQ